MSPRNNLMVAIRLCNDTDIFATKFTLEDGTFKLCKLAYSKPGEARTFVDESLNVPLEATRVHFIIHEGGKERTPYVDEVSTHRYDPPTPA